MKKSRLTVVIIILTAAVVLCAVGLWMYSVYAVVGSGFSRVVCRTDSTELDLTQSQLSSLRGIERIDGLTLLDVRGSDIPPQEIDRLAQALPGCEVLWSVPFSSGAADSTQTELTLPSAQASDLELVKYMTALESLTIGECELYEEIFALREELECQMRWSVVIDGVSYASDTAELTLGAVDASEAQKLRWLPELRHVDAAACSEYDALLSVSEYLPECKIVWRYTVLGHSLLSTDTLLDLSGEAVDEAALRSELDTALTYLPSLEKIDMCGCGLTDEQMAALREDYPQVKFVWLVSFGPRGHRYTVRTDITCFSTLLGNSKRYSGTQDDYKELFLYCTDLVALDMGHNDISDISLISNLTKLQMLIMTDNLVVDLSPLEACEDLFFLEFNKNRVVDVTPLTRMKNLKYVTLHYNRVEDISPLYNSDGLKILVLSENFDVPRNQKNEIAEALPDCSIYFKLPYGTGTGYEWDSLPERQALKNAFTNYEDILEFRSWDDIIWK